MVVGRDADMSSGVIRGPRSKTRALAQDLCLASMILSLRDEAFVLRTDLLCEPGPSANCRAMEVEDVDRYCHEHGETPE